MKLLFVTQSGYVRSFALLERVIGRQANLEKTGYYVSGRESYRGFLETVGSDWVASRDVLHEWDVINSAKASEVPKNADVAAVEKEFGDPTLWNAILCDRRVYYGKNCVFTQDYAPRFRHDEMLSIIHRAVTDIRDHLERLKPDAIVSFINVTFGEYCYYLVAKKYNIPYFNLRNTKVENYITAGPDIFEPSLNIKKAYERNFSSKDIDPDTMSFADSFVTSLARTRVTYEGQSYLSKKRRSRLTQIGADLAQIGFGAASSFRNWVSRVPKDNQTPDPLMAGIYNGIVKPLRYRKALHRHRNRMITLQVLKNMDFAFYPLHLEPEISLLTYSRPYLNQIEAIRWFSLAMPVNWKLVVKDHPKNPEYRSLGFYKKLFEIPNVLILPHDTSTFEIIQHARLVTILSGFVGFEALCQGKPVVALGKTAFEFLPETMYRRADDPRLLPQTVSDLLKNHLHDPTALVRFVYTVLEESVRFDWYTIGTLLQDRKWKNLDAFEKESGYRCQFENLANYLLAIITGQRNKE